MSRATIRRTWPSCPRVSSAFGRPKVTHAHPPTPRQWTESPPNQPLLAELGEHHSRNDTDAHFYRIKTTTTTTTGSGCTTEGAGQAAASSTRSSLVFMILFCHSLLPLTVLDSGSSSPHQRGSSNRYRIGMMRAFRPGMLIRGGINCINCTVLFILFHSFFPRVV